MSSWDSVNVTTLVSLDPDAAFALFTTEIGAWWKPKVRHLFRKDKTGVMKFEPGAGGRLVEVYADCPEEPFVVGNVLAWDPPARLAFEWRQGEFLPGEVTEVEVRFEPAGKGTRVTLVHRGWDTIPADHPARHGYIEGAFGSMIGLRWADLLTAFRASAIRRPDALRL